MTDRLALAVASVVANDNCSGCGGCTLVSERVSLAMSVDGFLRPTVAATGTGDDRREAELFESLCPGRRVAAPAASAASEHPLFGRTVSVWQAAAVNPAERLAGSSGGVLTALAAWLVETGQVTEVRGAAASPAQPRRTVPVSILSRDDALAAAGSRYAPVSALDGWRPEQGAALIAKPCEVSAAAQWLEASGADDAPIMLSFFCAGTPSQNATDRLIRRLGAEPGELAALRYRGDGWPGNFAVETADGRRNSLSYEESWGEVLGRDLQWRCKLCVDGTGAHADISVGDYWRADERGFPVFDEADGTSVAIARTARGDAILRRAAASGVIAISPLDADLAAAVQPLQRERKRVLNGRLLGRLLALRRVPRYRGYGLAALTLRSIPASTKAAVGTFMRTVGLRR